jgi:hypothetical protein
MNSFIHIPASYTFVPTPNPETESTAAGVEQQSAPVTKAPAEEAPIDLDTALNRLDVELAKLDELTDKDNRFPAELASIGKKT